jgi:predicted regulator of Ras-like GTPase activity (Roadblock/LC7/MglB family)
MSKEALVAEMTALRGRMVGITDTALAAVDGLLVASDVAEEMDSDALAALGAASLSLARRTALVGGRGTLRQNVTHCSGGYAVVYAIGDTALLLVLGDEGLDVERLHLECGGLIERISQLLHDPVSR